MLSPRRGSTVSHFVPIAMLRIPARANHGLLATLAHELLTSHTSSSAVKSVFRAFSQLKPGVSMTFYSRHVLLRISLVTFVLYSANRANHSSSSARMARTLWRMYSSRSRTRLSSTHRLLSRLHTPYMRSSRHWVSPLMTLRQCISEPRRLPCVSSTRRVNFITSRTESKRSNPSPFRKTNLLIAFATKPRHQLHGCIPAHLWRANNRVIVCCLSFDTSEAYPYSAFLVLTRKLSTPALMNYAQRLLALKTSASAWITMTQRNVPSVMPSQSL